jgi:hypothetical protein
MCDILLADYPTKNVASGRSMFAGNFGASSVHRETMFRYELGFCGKGLGRNTYSLQ